MAARCGRFGTTRGPMCCGGTLLSTLTNFLYDSGRTLPGGPSWWGLQKKEAVAHWANRIELLALVQDTADGAWFARPPQGAAIRPDPGPLALGTFTQELSEQSAVVRAPANEAIRQVATRRGLGLFMPLTETQGVYALIPSAAAAWAESPDLGAVDDTGAVYGYEGLYCIDGSIADLVGRESVADDLRSERAVRRAARRLGGRSRPAGGSGRSPSRRSPGG